MTNHNEAIGSSDDGSFDHESTQPDSVAQESAPPGAAGLGSVAHQSSAGNIPLHHGRGGDAERPGVPLGPPGHQEQVTLRSPSELADALPYLLGYRPEDSIVLVAMHDRNGQGRFGGRARLGLPDRADDWPSVADQLAQVLVSGSERRGAKPEAIVAFLCQDPVRGEGGRRLEGGRRVEYGRHVKEGRRVEDGRSVMERLRPLAQYLRTACGRLDVPVIEALCLSDGRFWSYCCPGDRCCPPEGVPMGLPGTSVLAAAATYAGLQVRGSLKEFRARLTPWENAAALEQKSALDAAGMALVPRMLDAERRDDVAVETLDLARRIMNRLADVPPAVGAAVGPSDRQDDELVAHDEAAALILGLQNRETRDRAAEWVESDEAPSALRLWRVLARRCVGPYREHAAAPLTLAGWVAWATGDELEGREALAMALGVDSTYLFARLLHEACNEGLDPQTIRQCFSKERDAREPAAVPTATADDSEVPTRNSSAPDPDSPDRLSADPTPADPTSPASPSASPACASLRSSEGMLVRRRRPRTPARDGANGVIGKRSSGGPRPPRRSDRRGPGSDR
ncbi:DUF4192 domain-containing protein [Streptomyces sp. NPDC058001]|uniref:DUF4192 domain-containing protein n=1 Tax=Streptomyces sp. NPDC058001 TaxID=3346300 RepID=UPI0036E406C6